VSGSGINWAICKSAPCSRQITTPAPHYSVFYRPDALPAAQPTVSKHWRQQTVHSKEYKVLENVLLLYLLYYLYSWYVWIVQGIFWHTRGLVLLRSLSSCSYSPACISTLLTQPKLLNILSKWQPQPGVVLVQQSLVQVMYTCITCIGFSSCTSINTQGQISFQSY